MTGRGGYAAAAGVLLVIEVAIALWVHDRIVRPFGGDTLAVVLVYCALRVVTGWRWPVALSVALGVAFAVELGQLAGVLGLLGLDDVTLARVVLGSSFAWGDLAAYLLGGVAVAGFERYGQRRV